ncbi:predicted protein [Sclerotinia sclerotiorum 1980 UF-70]|uniref:Uncharacterized protein n=1 Tax=Sclerotinia sclerotiorum (strain ATCC 18683 / 1980 / Ss-1) TaxID=665079 RepID=A7EKP3_SCLS1|nr:predicted protein [Sclerotinia sclerotiorum 1980 UF-70]EDO03409.1 predicted protein [Sclerotinia sclerotiorum 1980 UF-70]
MGLVVGNGVSFSFSFYWRALYILWLAMGDSDGFNDCKRLGDWDMRDTHVYDSPLQFQMESVHISRFMKPQLSCNNTIYWNLDTSSTTCPTALPIPPPLASIFTIACLSLRTTPVLFNPQVSTPATAKLIHHPQKEFGPINMLSLLILHFLRFSPIPNQPANQITSKLGIPN